MYRTLFALGVAIQVLALAAIAVPTPLSWRQGWIAFCVASFVGVGFTMAAGVTAKQRPAFQTLVFLGSAAAIVGLGSWFVVALTSEKGDPVINVTGLLCVIGWGATVGAAVVDVVSKTWERDGTHRTWAWAFTLAIAAGVAASFAGSAFLGEAFFGPWLIASLIFPFVVGTAQIAVAWRSTNSSTARPLSIAAGAVLLIGCLTFQFTAIALHLVLSTVAAVIELVSSHKSASNAVANNETMEE